MTLASVLSVSLSLVLRRLVRALHVDGFLVSSSRLNVRLVPGSAWASAWALGVASGGVGVGDTGSSYGLRHVVGRSDVPGRGDAVRRRPDSRTPRRVGNRPSAGVATVDRNRSRGTDDGRAQTVALRRTRRRSSSTDRSPALRQRTRARAASAVDQGRARPASRLHGRVQASRLWVALSGSGGDGPPSDASRFAEGRAPPVEEPRASRSRRGRRRDVGRGRRCRES